MGLRARDCIRRNVRRDKWGRRTREWRIGSSSSSVAQGLENGCDLGYIHVLKGMDDVVIGREVEVGEKSGQSREHGMALGRWMIKLGGIVEAIVGRGILNVRGRMVRKDLLILERSGGLVRGDFQRLL